MRLLRLGPSCIALLALQAAATSSDLHLTNRTAPAALNITAIDAIRGVSVLQCWQLAEFQVSTTPGIAGSLGLDLGRTSNATYSVIGPRTDGGLHNAPVPQLVFFASGLIHITLPNGTDDAWVVGGKYGLIFAQDTADKSRYGHRTNYVADEDTIALAVPLAPGQELKHRVLHHGACTWAEMAGL